MTKPTIDPIRLEVIRNSLVAGAEEMNVSIWRTARSTVVRETLDYSTALFSGDGQAVAQSTRIPVHLNSMSVCLSDIIEHHLPLDTWADGDVILTNDPYCGGQHLPDFVVFRPVFYDGQRIAIAAAIVHHIDVGGGAAGSYYAGAREVFQEGLRIPPIKLVDASIPNDAVLAIIRQNSREPEKIIGDLRAQTASLAVGARAIERLAQRYDATTIATAMSAVIDQSEQRMRAAITQIPDGTYVFKDYVDDDGQSTKNIEIVARVEVKGDECLVDLSESADQAPGPVNCTLNMARSGVYCALLSAADGSVMANSGAYRPVKVVSRPGSVVSCREPAPVANRMATGHRIVTTVLGALAQAIPERIPAAYYGVSYVAALSAPDRFESDQKRVYFEIEVGGWGGHPQGDGANGYSAGFHNLANSPLEMCESLFPVTFTHYGFIEGSGGDGQFRGGLGLAREWRLEAETGSLSGSFERFTHAPYGLNGGSPGSLGRFVHISSTGTVELPSKVSGVELRRGDRVRLETSGGGGWGNPADRLADSRLADEQAGYT